MDAYHEVPMAQPFSDAQNDDSEKQRQRTTRACDFCRRKKVKCYFTPGKSCTNCVSYGITCEFNDGTKKRGPPKGYIDALERRIHHLENMLTERVSSGSNSQPSTPTEGSSLLQGDLAWRSGTKRPRGGSSDRVRYLGDMSILSFLSSKLNLGKDDNDLLWMGQHVRKFGNQVVLVDDEHDNAGQSIPQMSLPMFPIPSIQQWIYAVSAVDKHTSDRLLKIYFSNVHPVLPVINKTAFLKQYRDKADSYPPPELLNAVFGSAARFVEYEALNQKSKAVLPPEAVWDVPKGWSDQFFERSQMIITRNDNWTTISKVQSIILICNHNGNPDYKSSAYWILGGIAIRLAQGLGLNRSCDDWDIPESEKQTRKRVWWALYAIDKFQSAAIGRPSCIRDEDIDVGYPDPSALWKEVLDTPEKGEEDSGPRFPSAMCKPTTSDERVEIYQLFNQAIKLSEILGRILQGLYTPKAHRMSYERGCDAIVTRLDHELTEWRFAFPKALEQANFGDFEEGKGYLSPAIACLYMCYFSFLILLHRPFIEQPGPGKSKSNPQSSYSSFRIGTSAAIRGTRIAAHLGNRDFRMFPFSFSLYPLLQCCLIHMYNTKNPDARISTTAKVELGKSVAIVKRLQGVSNAACRLHDLLNNLMSKLSIEVPAHAPDITDAATAADASQVSGDMEDRAKSSGWSFRRSSPNVNGNASLYGASTPPTRSTNPLLSPLAGSRENGFNNAEMAKSVASTPSPSSIGEAFTLKQFGFSTPGDVSQLDYTTQDVSFFSEFDSLPPMPGYAAYNSSGAVITAPTTVGSTLGVAPMTAPGMSSFQLDAVSLPASLSTGQTALSGDGSTVFRNSPSNAFWGMPASMDWSEWSEWNQRSLGADIGS